MSAGSSPSPSILTKTVAPSAAACRIPLHCPNNSPDFAHETERKLDYLEWFCTNVQFPLGRHHQPHKSADTPNHAHNFEYGALLDSKGMIPVLTFFHRKGTEDNHNATLRKICKLMSAGSAEEDWDYYPSQITMQCRRWTIERSRDQSPLRAIEGLQRSRWKVLPSRSNGLEIPKRSSSTASW